MEDCLQDVSTNIQVSPQASRLLFIDISHYESVTNWTQVQASGVTGVILKASEGLGTDPTFAARWGALAAIGMIRGAYHFFRASVDPEAQAEHFLRVVGPINNNDLPLILDWEISDGVDITTQRVRAQVFLDKVKASTGRLPMIYGGPYFLQGLNLQSSFDQYPLWVAHYHTDVPKIPRPWSTCALWQFSDESLGLVKGVNTCDRSWFEGTRDDLQRQLLVQS